MNIIGMMFLGVLLAMSLPAQDSVHLTHERASLQSSNDGANLPAEPIGKNDLIGITVYDCPELTHTVRVDSNAEIRLPMLRNAIHAGGLYPSDLEHVITVALVKERVLVSPIVSVSVVEYRSRPISVVGAVKSPVTFQAEGVVTLLAGISQAGGLAENAGPEIFVSRQRVNPDGLPGSTTQRISVRDLFNSADPSLNMELQGGDVISIPVAGRVYVVGNVKKPGMFSISDGPSSSVLKAIALSDGLDKFSKHTAYIYRVEEGNSQRREIPVALTKILNRQASDVLLQADDILYIPDAAGLRASLTILDRAVGVSAGLGATLLYVSR